MALGPQAAVAGSALHNSECLAFVRHSVDYDGPHRRTSILEAGHRAIFPPPCGLVYGRFAVSTLFSPELFVHK